MRKNRWILAVTIGVLSWGLVPSSAEARRQYNPGLKRFMQRDPLARSPKLNLYESARRDASSTTNRPQAHTSNSIDSWKKENTCCRCLLFAEDRGHPHCQVLTQSVLCNRQNTDWPEFDDEKTYCDAASSGGWAGGPGNKNYDNCAKGCVSGSDEQEVNLATLLCLIPCMDPAPDPAFGAQFAMKCGTEPGWLTNDRDCRQTVSCGGDCYWHCDSQPDGQ